MLSLIYDVFIYRHPLAFAFSFCLRWHIPNRQTPGHVLQAIASGASHEHYDSISTHLISLHLFSQMVRKVHLPKDTPFTHGMLSSTHDKKAQSSPSFLIYINLGY